MTTFLLILIVACLWTISWKLYDIYELLNKHDKPWLYEPDETGLWDKPNKKGKK